MGTKADFETVAALIDTLCENYASDMAGRNWKEDYNGSLEMWDLFMSRVAKTLVEHGWTEAEYDAEIDRRYHEYIKTEQQGA